jgi:REP element-mobilizing transposase RayT
MTFHRRSVRLRGYDYSRSGAYFVTLCVQNGVCLFGEIADGEMILNPLGKLASEEWLKSAVIRPGIQLDEFVVMPNHFHGIVALPSQGTNAIRQEAHCCAPLQRRPRSLGSLIAEFKGITTKCVNEIHQAPGTRIWQRNFHDRVIRDDGALIRIRNYIISNPVNWLKDEYHPLNLEKSMNAGCRGAQPCAPKMREQEVLE